MMRKLLKSEKGAVLPLMGVALFTLLLAVGLTIDYARALIVKERMQWALDAGALAGTKKAKGGDDAVQAEAQRYFDANFPIGYMSTSRATVNAVSKSAEDSRGTAYRYTVSNVSMNTYIMNTVGLDNMGVGAAAEVNTLPVTPLDVVFSVDMSGSMLVSAGKGCDYLPYDNDCYGSTSKLDAAKTEMQNLLRQLDSGADTRFGIVPWSSYVNINGVVASAGIEARTCFDGRQVILVADENPSKAWEGNASTFPDEVIPMADERRCREYFPNTIRNVGSLRPMLYLTPNSGIVSTAINDLQAEANTDGALGMHWAYAMLEDSNKGWVNWEPASINKSIVLLTDGNNTKYWPEPGVASGNVAEKTDPLQLHWCQAAKDKKITVYTIAYDMRDGDPARKAAKDMLFACASDRCPEQPGGKCYFDANNDNALHQAMKSIGQTMMTLRLTR